MAVTQAVCNSFKTEVLTATHNFTAAAQTIRIALLAVGSSADKNTTNFSGITEVGNSGTYASQTASQNLTSVTPALDADTAVCDFNDISWTGATISAIGALIYNNTQSNKGIVVLDFGGTKTSTAGTFAITFPAATAAAAILRIA